MDSNIYMTNMSAWVNYFWVCMRLRRWNYVTFDGNKTLPKILLLDALFYNLGATNGQFGCCNGRRFLAPMYGSLLLPSDVVAMGLSVVAIGC